MIILIAGCLVGGGIKGMLDALTKARLLTVVHKPKEARF